MTMKLLIVGGVAGGATAAARARRLDEFSEIILFERGEHISFANCGLPYYIGREIKQRSALLVTTPEKLRSRFNIDVRTRQEVVEIHPRERKISVRNLETDEVYQESYDKLLLSPGAEPVRPPFPGIDLETIFTMRNIPDTVGIEEFIKKKKPKSAVIVGGGFIGLEMAENLGSLGFKVTIVEMLDQVLPPLDPEMAEIVHTHLRSKKITLLLGEGVSSFSKVRGKTKITTQMGSELTADMVILSIGVRPETQLARNAGVLLGRHGGIRTDEFMRTSDPDIYAVGDAVEVSDFISGRPSLIPLAGPANRQARIAADNIFGRASSYRGTKGTAILKVFDLTVAHTGNSEKLLKARRIPYRTSFTHPISHAEYYPGSEQMSIKLLFSPRDGKILGAQIVGGEGVDKRIDVLATAIHSEMSVFDLEELELAYAPPYSSAKDPVNMAGFVASNMLRKDLETVNWDQLDGLDRSTHILLDVRSSQEQDIFGLLEGSINIPVDELRSRRTEIDKEKTYIAYCTTGYRSYVACRILMQHGFSCKNLSGGYQTLSVLPKYQDQDNSSK